MLHSRSHATLKNNNPDRFFWRVATADRPGRALRKRYSMTIQLKNEADLSVVPTEAILEELKIRLHYGKLWTTPDSLEPQPQRIETPAEPGWLMGALKAELWATPSREWLHAIFAAAALNALCDPTLRVTTSKLSEVVYGAMRLASMMMDAYEGPKAQRQQNA